MIDPETWCALHALTADYWRRVDRQSEAPVDELYVEDGVMHIASLRCEGRDRIREFFVDRTAMEQASERTTRHSASGLAIEALGPARYRIRSTVQVLSGTGGWPLLSAPASTVGDFEDIVVKSARGQWLFESRVAQIVFAGAGAAAFTR